MMMILALLCALLTAALYVTGRRAGLRLFSRTSSRRAFNLAAFHSPHSLTWSWIVSVAFDGIWRRFDSPGLRIGFHPYRTNGGLQLVICLPGVTCQWHRQREMWFRDMYRRADDARDQLESRNRRLQRAQQRRCRAGLTRITK